MKILEESLPRPRLAVAMIARDEAAVLAESLASARPVADEIVVLDTGSTDQTVAIAAQAGATVQHMPWPDDFSAARNRCLEAVTADWVLWLDAGERLTADSALMLRRLLDEKADRQKVYSLWIEVPPRGNGASAEQVAQPRLMPAGMGLRFEGRVRETLRPAVREAGMGIEIAPGRILRHPWHHDQARSASKARRDLALAAEEAAEIGLRPPRLLLAAGEAHGVLGNNHEAREAFREAIRTADRGSIEMLEAYYGLLTSFDGEEQPPMVQMTACLEALRIFPFDTQLLMAMGNHLLVHDRPELAVRSFEAAMRFGRITPEVWHLRESREVAAACLALAFQAQQRDGEACRALEEALQMQGRSARLQRHLLSLYVKHGKTEQAVALAEQMAVDSQQRETFLAAIAGASRAAWTDWPAAAVHLQTAYAALEGKTTEVHPATRRPRPPRFAAAAKAARGRKRAAVTAGNTADAPDRSLRVDPAKDAGEPALESPPIHTPPRKMSARRTTNGKKSRK